MGFSDETYAAAKKYTDNTVAGAGGLAGVPCQIQSITPITGGNRVTFLWIDNNGDEHTSTMNVMNGVDGEDGEDGKGIQSVSVNAENHLIITYTDGTSADAGQIEIHSAVDSVNGQTGAVTLDAEDVGALPDDTPIPSKTSNLTNDSGFITKVVNDLVNYYLKSETYSKTEVDDIVTAIKNSRFEVVATLPTTDIKTNVIYLVPKDPVQTSNVKDEYINLDGTTSGWEKIGDTEIDLSNYVTTQALNTALAAYTTTADLTTLLAGKQDTLTFDNAPTENSNNPVKSGGVYSANANIYAEMTRQGVKNILSQQFDEVMMTASLGNKATSANGLTLTYNSDGSIKINGTPTDSSKYVAIRFDWDTNNHPFDISYLAGKKIVVSISETEINGIKIIPGYFDASDVAHQYSGADITTKGEYTYSNDAKWARCYLSISGAYSYNDVTVYPMIYIPFEGATDDYTPPTKTNQELTAENQTLMNNIDVLFETGVKNICPPYSGSYSANGITYTGNSDGTVTVNGTCSANVGANIRVYLKAGQYKVSGCPRGGSYSTYRIGVTTDSWTLVGTHDHGNGTTITIPSDGYYRINLDVRAGYVANNLVFKPMITDVDTPESDYDHYVPYAKTNLQLTQDSVDWDEFSKLGAVNYLDSDACTTVDSSSGLTFTVNSDKTVTVSATSGTYPFTSTALVNFVLKLKPEFSDKLPLKLSGCPSGGDSLNGYNLNYTNYSNTDNKVVDIGDGAIISTQFNYTTYPLAGIRIQVRNGTTLTGPLTFKPMLTEPSYNGPYVPYAKSNRKLTEDTASAIANVPNGAINLAKPVSARTTTVSDVEFVIDSEGKVTANGTASANIRFDMAEVTLKAGRTYKICEPSSLQARRPFFPETYRCYARIKSSGVWVLQNNSWKGSYTPTEDVVVSVGIAMQSGNQVTDEIFAPMLVLDGTDVGDTFYPYAMTNRELTEVVTNQLGDATLAGTYLSDCNNVASSGTLNIYNASSSTANSPYTTGVETSSNSFVILSRVDANNNWGMQLAIPMTSTKGIYMRFKASGTWGTWSKITP